MTNIYSKIITPYNSKNEYIMINEKIFLNKITKNYRFPYNFSIIENTLTINDNSLKNIIYLIDDLNSGIYLETKIIGLLKYTDKDKNLIQYIISVPQESKINNILNLPSYLFDNTKNFIKYFYKGSKIKVFSREEGIELYNDCVNRYNYKNKEIEKKNKKNRRQKIINIISKFFKKKNTNIKLSPSGSEENILSSGSEKI